MMIEITLGIFGGILLGFGARGILEFNMNKDIKGYRSFFGGTRK